MIKHYVSYEDFLRIARAEYAHGGDCIVECWERYQFDEYVKLFGKVTARRVYVMCKQYYEQECEAAGMTEF